MMQVIHVMMLNNFNNLEHKT